MKLARTLCRVNTLVNLNANGHLADSGSQIGARLKAAREAAGLTQEDVAAKLDVHVVTVSRWESAGVNARGDTLVRLAALYGRSVESLVGERRLVKEGPPELSANVSRGTSAKARPPQHLPRAIREYLAELRLHLTKGGVSDDEIGEADDLLRSPALFGFYNGDEAGVLRGMKAIAESVIIPELRARRTLEEGGARKEAPLTSFQVPDAIATAAAAEIAPLVTPAKESARPAGGKARGRR